MHRIIISAAALLALATPGLAETFALTIENGASSDLVRFTVKDGEVEGFRTVGINGVGEVTVTLPDGVCKAEYRLGFADEINTDGTFDFCENAHFVIAPDE